MKGRGFLFGLCALSLFIAANTLPARSAAAVSISSGEKGAAKAHSVQKWETTLANAKKEGKVLVYTIWAAKTRTLLTQAFKDKYGIELEFTPFARGSDLLARYQAEKRAGLLTADVFGVGANSFINMIKPEGLLGPIEPLLILPEVTDPKGWTGGKFPFIDRDRQVIGMIAAIQRHLDYNINMVKEGEISGYKDLLKPQYKGKIAMADPSMTGTALAMFSHMAHDLWTVEEASQWLR